MIVSITCRHGTEANTNRDEVGRELLALSKYDPGITRAQVIYSKDTHHKNAADLVTCHLSIYAPNKHQVDIYEYQPTEMQAFYQAKERAIKQITRNYSYK
jgi:hypothetical protein